MGYDIRQTARKDPADSIKTNSDRQENSLPPILMLKFIHKQPVSI